MNSPHLFRRIVVLLLLMILDQHSHITVGQISGPVSYLTDQVLVSEKNISHGNPGGGAVRQFCSSFAGEF